MYRYFNGRWNLLDYGAQFGNTYSTYILQYNKIIQNVPMLHKIVIPQDKFTSTFYVSQQ